MACARSQSHLLASSAGMGDLIAEQTVASSLLSSRNEVLSSRNEVFPSGVSHVQRICKQLLDAPVHVCS